jgi:hypothetical protein
VARTAYQWLRESRDLTLPRRRRLETEHADLAPLALKQQLGTAMMQVERLLRKTVTLPVSYVEQLAAFGAGNLSEGIRLLAETAYTRGGNPGSAHPARISSADIPREQDLLLASKALPRPCCDLDLSRCHRTSNGPSSPQPTRARPPGDHPCRPLTAGQSRRSHNHRALF